MIFSFTVRKSGQGLIMVSTEVSEAAQHEIEMAAHVDARIDEVRANAHPAIAEILRFFKCSHLPLGLRGVSAILGSTAYGMAASPHLRGAELTVGLRKLLEAKDAFVRAALP